MDISDVKTKVDKHISANNTLTLRYQNNDLNSSSIDAVINIYFAGTLSGIVQRVKGETATIANEQVIYRLNLDVQNFSLYQNTSAIEAQITYFIKDDVIQFIVEATMPSNYSLADSFNDFKNQPTLPINQVKLEKCLITLRSEEKSSIRLNANLPPIGLLKNISWMIVGDLILTGTIHFETVNNKQFPIMNLEANILSPFPFGIFTLDIIIRLRSLILSFPNNKPAYIFSSYVELVTEFVTPSLTIPVVMPLYGEGQFLLSFYLDLAKPRPPINSLDALSGFTAGNNPKQLLNPELAIGQATFSLESLSAVLDPYAKQLVSVQIGVGLELNWTIITNTLELEKIGAVFTINDPAQPKVENIGTFLFAELKVGSVYLDTAILLPERILQAQLAAGSEIDISEVIDTFAKGISLPGKGELIISQLDVLAQIKKGEEAYSLEAGAYGTLTIIDGLIIDNIHFFISYQFQALSEVRLSSTLFLTNIQLELFLLAEYSKESGWYFEGGTGAGQDIPMGKLIADLGNIFLISESEIPDSVKELIIKNLHVSFNSKSKDFTFTCESQFPIDDRELDIIVTINITRQGDDSYNKHFEGHITIGGLQFALVFDTDQTSKTFLAAYHDTNDNEISVRDLIGSISSTLKNDIPEGLTISLKDALFAYQKKDTQTNFLFGLDIGSGINLSNLPLVGKEFPPDQTIKLAYQVLVTKADFSPTEITHLNGLNTQEGIKLPEKGITNRLDLAASMRLGQETRLLSLPIEINQKSGQLQQNSQSASAVPASADVTGPDGTKWFQLQKSFGPVHFERIGLKYQDQKIWFLLDASLSTAGLTLSLDGLSVSSPLTKFDPEFNLHGLGIDYKNGPLEIGGAFLKGKITFEGKEYDDYSGMAIIRTETLTLAAIGSYVKLDEGPSMFVYAVLDYPMGGPAFFFVTGLAAGFGYNRLLHVPPVDQINSFPLVQEAMGELTGTPNLAAELARLQQYIPPSVGNYFLAVGIRFTSFKMIDSFILLTATFGHRFELDVVGLSTLVLPAPDSANAGVTPIAEVQLALRATFIPDDGFFGISAQLTNNSFLLDRKCHLTGGFAFYTWFAGDHDGDFVLSVGGYHPNFSVPSHYPAVPRLGFNWQVNDKLTFKGSAYFALTPSALMAGCSLSATWNDGNLQAWFDAGLNFLISWKPYHYEADFHISLGASYTFEFFGTHHISAHLGADVSIWGPDFAGKAEVSWTIISFTIFFGDSNRNQLKPISWSQFRESFLPRDEQICTMNLKAGLINRQAAKDSSDTQQNDSNDLGIVNPKTLCLTTDCVVPLKHAYTGSEASQAELDYGRSTTAFNIGSMQLSNSQIVSKQRILITCNGNHAEAQFDFPPLTKNVPTALWGSQLKPSLQGEQVVPNLLTGYEIRAKRPTEAPHTAPIDYKTLQQAATLYDAKDAFSWSQLAAFVAKELNDKAARQEIQDTLHNDDVAKKRAAIANALFDNASLDLNGLQAEDFLSVPQVN